MIRSPSREQRLIGKLRQNQSAFNLSGVFRALVESDQDPSGLGRVQVRVFALHGDENRTPARLLPWADLCSQGGGGYDFGSDNAPPVGAWVFVVFECGHEDQPVVLGGARGKPRDPQGMLTDRDWITPKGQPETAKESVFDGGTRTRRIWEKSLKGHTIYVEDQDGQEFLRIVDRAGQMIEMRCRTVPEENKGNLQQRGVRTTERGDALSPQTNMQVGQSYIRILDLAGNELTLDPSAGSESVLIKNRSPSGAQEQTVELSMRGGKPFIRLKGSENDLLELLGGGEIPIRLEDHVGNQILFRENATEDGSQAQGVHLTSAGDVTLTGRAIRLTTRGDQRADLGGNLDEIVAGNALQSVGNDKVTVVGGNVQRTTGGAVTETITNTQLNPATTPDFAHDVLIVAPPNVTGKGAGDRLQVVGLGDIVREILGTGNFKFQTAIGDFLIESLAPSAGLNAAIRIRMGGAPSPTVIEITNTGDVILDTGGALGGKIQLGKLTGLVDLTGQTGTETYTATKTINAASITLNAPLVQLGPAPALGMVNITTLQTILAAWQTAFCVANPRAPGPLALVSVPLVITPAVSATCVMSP